MAVRLAPPAWCARRELRLSAAEHVGDRLGEGDPDRSRRSEPRTRRRAAECNRQVGGRKPADRDRSAEPLPRAGRRRDRDRARRSPTPERKRAPCGAEGRGGRVRRRPRSPDGRSSPLRATLERTVSQRSLTPATGARIVPCTWRVLPSAQPSQLGRRTTASTETVSPGVRSVRGVRRPSRTASGILRPPGPNARTCSSVPPKGCTSTRARAVASSPSVMPDHSTTPATSPSSATTTTVTNPHRTRRRARRGGGRFRERSTGEGLDWIATLRGYGAPGRLDLAGPARRPREWS